MTTVVIMEFSMETGTKLCKGRTQEVTLMSEVKIV